MDALFILSTGGEVIIERHLRPSTLSSRAVCSYFWSYCQKTDDTFAAGGAGHPKEYRDDSQQSKANIPPVLLMPNGQTYVVSVFRDSLIFLATLTAESPPLLSIEFLHRLADIFTAYFGPPLTDELVKENFATVYQLLEEMADNGQPLTTEPNALMAVISPPTVMGKVQQ